MLKCFGVGGVCFPDFAFVTGERLFLTRGRDLVRERDSNGEPLRTQRAIQWYDIEADGKDRIRGTAAFPNDDGVGLTSVSFTGTRIPPYGVPPDPEDARYGEPVELFNGKNLEGWRLLNPGAANGWKVVDGVMVNDPVQKPGEEHIHYGNIRTVDSYGDFNLKIGVNVPEGSNSGIYLRGIYEIQVFDSYGKPRDSHHMGALYSRITPAVSAEKPAGEWQKFDITLYKRHLTVVLNGTTIIDNQPVEGVTGGALTSDEFQPGPLYLQGDHGKVSYREMVLTPILE